MSARPDVRGLPAAGPPGSSVAGGAPQAHPLYASRHQPHAVNQRHTSNAAAAAAASAAYLSTTSAVDSKLRHAVTTSSLPMSAAALAAAARQQQPAAAAVAYAAAFAGHRPPPPPPPSASSAVTAQQQEHLARYYAAAAASSAPTTQAAAAVAHAARDAYVRAQPSDHRGSNGPSQAGVPSAVGPTSSATPPRITLRQFQPTPQSLYSSGTSSSAVTHPTTSSSNQPHYQRHFAAFAAAAASASAPPPPPPSQPPPSWHSPVVAEAASTTSHKPSVNDSAGAGSTYTAAASRRANVRPISSPPPLASGLLTRSSPSTSSTVARRTSGDNASYLEMMAAHQHAIAAAAAQQHAAIQQLPLHPAAAASSTSAAAAVAAAASSADLHGQSKRPRLDLIVAGSGNTYTLGSGAPGGSHPPPQPPPAATGSASTRHPVAALSTPLTIDTRESAVKESGYHPQVEQISPTGPEAPSLERDELKSTKDDLLQKITKVDREMAKAESQIAKLKKKQQELEKCRANKASSSSQGEGLGAPGVPGARGLEEEERGAKNQSIAQLIYAENRKRARTSHLSLAKLAPLNDLPLYNQPSDTDLYHDNKRNHHVFKKRLVEFFRKRTEERETRERYLTETYARLQSNWAKKVERVESSRRRKERDVRARELYEKIFPELRKQREDKERDHRLGSRGGAHVRSEADMEDVIERLQERELEDKKMHSYAVIPPLLLPAEERRRRFVDNNGLIADPLKDYEERKFVNTWTDAEKEIFKEKFLLHPKNFGQIAQFLERKTVSECVQYYYLSKKTENYKQLMRRVKVRRGKRTQQQQQQQVDVLGVQGVITRNRNQRGDTGGDAGKEADSSNRSTPQPVKQEVNDEDMDKKGGRGKNSNESSDEETGKNVPNSIAGKASFCPMPTCTTTKSRVKSRLRHLPKKWSSLTKESKEAIASELQIPAGMKKCCSACFTRIMRKISQANSDRNSPPSAAASPSPSSTNATTNAAPTTGGASGSNTAAVGATGAAPQAPPATAPRNSAPAEVPWTADETERMKSCLRAQGRNWAAVAEKMGSKTAEQCKKFFYVNRKKMNLDKVVLEYKRANQPGDQPPTLSTDEESGSSTSSCDEETSPMNTNASRSNSPVTRSADAKAPVGGVKTEIKTEAIVKTEIKVEEGASSTPGPSGAPTRTGIPGKEEDNDSSATISADEREVGGDGGITVRPAPYCGYNRLSAAGTLDPRGSLPSAIARQTFPASNRFPAPQPPPMRPPQVANGPRDTITVKELMINVIERSLSTPASGQANAGAGTAGTNASAPATVGTSQVQLQSAGTPIQQQTSQQLQQPQAQAQPNIVSPTIHTLLEHSDPTPQKGPYGPVRKGPMAPPPAPASSGECETLDLSMPRRRDPTPPASAQSSAPPQPLYREPSFSSHHPRGSPSIKTEFSQQSKNVAPPPAHSGTKVKTNPDPYYRGDQRQPATSPVIYGPDGRPLSVAGAAHLVHRSSSAQSPGLGRPSNAAASVTPRTMQYVQRPHQAPHKTAPSISPKMPGVGGGRPLTIQTGSITQGTPVVNQSNIGRSSTSAYEPLIKVTPPEKAGSITHGTPVFDKKHTAVISINEHGRHDYYRSAGGGASVAGRPSASPGGYGGYPVTSTSSGTASAAQSRSSSYGGGDPHMNSRQVIISDYQMARSSTEMQRRPDSREHPRSASPTRMRDHSPRPRSIEQRVLTDPRGQLEIRRDTRAVIDPRYGGHVDPRMLADPKAEIRALDQRSDPRVIHDLRNVIDPRSDHRATVSFDPRGDPRAGLDPRGDPRAGLDPRGDPRAGLDPRAMEHRSDPRLSLTQHSRSSGDMARVISEASRSLDPRAQPQQQLDVRNIRYYPQHSQAQLYMTTDGKFAHPSSRPRSPLRSSAPSASTPPPRASSSAAVIHRAVGGGITSGKPIVSKAPAPASTLGHREVEIYRSNPEVTISKTSSSPRQQQQHAYGDHNNPLASLVDVALQQQKLPDVGKERERAAAALLQQQQAAAAAAASRQVYESHQQQLLENRYAASLQQQQSSVAPASAAAAVSSASTQQLVQQVRSERAKQQQLYLMQDKDRIERDFGPSTSTASGPPSASASKGPSAACLIDAIITQSINSGPPVDGGSSIPPKQFRRSPAELAAATPQEEAAAKAAALAAASTSPFKVRSPNSLKHVEPSAQVVNGPEEGPGSRPGSRGGSHSASITDQEGKDSHLDSKNPEQYWKRRGFPDRPGPPPVSSSSIAIPRSGGPALAPGPSGEERQITRVSQPQAGVAGSPSKAPASNPTSPGSTERVSPNSSDALARYVRKTPQTSSSTAPPGTLTAQQAPQVGDPSQKGPQAPGLSPLDYVKNKIVEEMTKGEGNGNGAKRTLENSSSPQAKSPVEAASAKLVDNSNGETTNESPRKKLRLEEEALSTAASSQPPLPRPGTSATPSAPDSPGSEGEMVIDESVPPDSVSGEKPTESPAHAQQKADKDNAPNSSNGVFQQSASSSTAPAKPRYEPLSDDE